MATFSLSMVDMALWDIAAKSLNIPVYRMLGGYPGTFFVYASDGLWLVSPLQAAKEAEAFAQSGFSSMKMRFGRKGREDLDAIHEVRRAVGDHALLGDANQGWTREQAGRLGSQMAPYDLGWLEEPIDAEDLSGYKYLSRSLNLRIASGENLYGSCSFRRFLEEHTNMVYTPDLQRIGGISGWKRIYSLLEVYKAPYSLHLFPEYAVHLFAAAKTPEKLEYMSWSGDLFKEPLRCKGGTVKTPERPGVGMEWDEQRIALFEIK